MSLCPLVRTVSGSNFGVRKTIFGTWPIGLSLRRNGTAPAVVDVKKPRHLRFKKKDSLFVRTGISLWMAFFYCATGGAVASIVWYFLAPSSGRSLFEKSFRFVEKHPQVVAALGSPVRAHNSPLAGLRGALVDSKREVTKNSTIYSVRYYIEGPLGDGVVRVKAVQRRDGEIKMKDAKVRLKNKGVDIRVPCK